MSIKLEKRKLKIVSARNLEIIKVYSSLCNNVLFKLKNEAGKGDLFKVTGQISPKP